MRSLIISLIGFLVLNACNSVQPRIQQGDWVCFNYALEKKNGVRLDNNRCYQPCANQKGEPFCVQAGQGWLVAGWDEALIGMQAGETKHILLPPYKAWGSKNPPTGILPTDTLKLTIEVLSVN